MTSGIDRFLQGNIPVGYIDEQNVARVPSEMIELDRGDESNS